MELLVCEDIESPPPPAWFWTRALNLASILEVMLAVAQTTLQLLPPSELAAGIGRGGFKSNNRSQQWKESDDHSGVNHGGSL